MTVKPLEITDVSNPTITIDRPAKTNGTSVSNPIQQVTRFLASPRQSIEE